MLDDEQHLAGRRIISRALAPQPDTSTIHGTPRPAATAKIDAGGTKPDRSSQRISLRPAITQWLRRDRASPPGSGLGCVLISTFFGKI
ncbi:MAG: hypothetical protein R3F22_05650 [Lysobacteraceae bacterium]